MLEYIGPNRRNLINAANRVVLWLVFCAALLLLTPEALKFLIVSGRSQAPYTELPCTLLLGLLGLVLTYPILSCFRAHALRLTIAMLNGSLGRILLQAQRDSISVYDDQLLVKGRSDLGQILLTTHKARKAVSKLFVGLTVFAAACLIWCAAFLVMIVLLLFQQGSLHFGNLCFALICGEVGILLICGCRRTRREFPSVGPSEEEVKKAEGEIVENEKKSKRNLGGG